MTDQNGWWTKVLLAGNGHLSAKGEGTERYVLLPKASDPRVVVDASSTPALREALRRFALARSLPNQVGQAAALLSPMARTVAPAWRVTPAAGHPTLREHLANALDADVRLSIAVGPPRPNRKPVVRCFDGARLVAVAKLGPDPHTAAMVRNEAEWLGHLAANPIAGVITPDLLHHGQFGDSELLVMSVLPLVSDAGVPFDEVPNDRLDVFIERGCEGKAGLEASTWWDKLQQRLSTLDDAVVKSAIGRVTADTAGDALALGAFHGDWSPWNVGRSTDGRWCIWDWERTTTGVPIGLDQLHLHHQYGEGLAGAGAALELLGVTEEQVPLLHRLYLLELVARHAESDSLKSDRHATVLQLLAAEVEGRGDAASGAQGAS